MPNEKTINRYVLERARQARLAHGGGIVALRGSGKGLWPQGAGRAVAELRDEWQAFPRPH